MTRSILAIDPGTSRSGWCYMDADKITFAVDDNDLVLTRVGFTDPDDCDLVIEEFASYGMPIGKSCLDTVLYTGRLMDRWYCGHGREAILIPRRNVKLHLCGSVRAKDGNVRQALIDRYGGSKAVAVGVKKAPGPLYGCKADAWSALALAVTYMDGGFQ